GKKEVKPFFSKKRKNVVRKKDLFKKGFPACVGGGELGFFGGVVSAGWGFCFFGVGGGWGGRGGFLELGVFWFLGEKFQLGGERGSP
ncbi:hypothetical protein, partial [Enterococcus faecium]